MRRFAYPNVSGKEFIGCGRYRAFSQGEENDEKLAQLGSMGNAGEVSSVAHDLASELTRSSAPIYETKERPLHPYTGSSKNLAYCLALIHGVRRVRKPFQALEGDIWCTGEIKRGPLLEIVDQNSFNRKLLAFLASANHDRLFLVPTVNLTPVKPWCQNPPCVAEWPDSDKILGVQDPLEPAQVFDLSDFGAVLDSASPDTFHHKAVIGIAAGELQQLVTLLFESPPDPEIAQWFQALTDLRVQDQITDERYWEVLEHVVGAPVPRSRSHEALLDALATHRERLYLKSTTTAEQLSKIPLREVRTTRVHQVLVALRYALPVIQTVLGLRFVLIPPGTVHDLVMTTPYYLAETPISHADWARILGSSLESAPSASRAAVDITPLAIERFVTRANAQVGATLRLVVPSERQWRFAVEAAGPLEPPPRGTLAGPILKTTLPSALGLYDVLGMVYQLCQQGRGRYAWYGGSYRTPASDFSPRPVPVLVTTAAFAKNPEWGFRPALASLEDQRWA